VGKEVKIGAMGKTLGIYRKEPDYALLLFKYVLIFTTDTDCTGPFIWTLYPIEGRYPITTSDQVIWGRYWGGIH
jgi:hypothetical protein